MPAHKLATTDEAATPTLAVCSWSLRPQSPADLAADLRAAGLEAVQLALDPVRTGAWDEQDTIDTLNHAGIRIISGMMTTLGEDYSSLETIRETGGVRPDATWDQNLAAARQNALLAQRLGLCLVTLHAGFIPHDAGDPEWMTLIERLRTLTDVFADAGVRLGLETGQESAGALIRALDAVDRPGLGVNFDPANMILYGMGDPVAALRTLAPRVLQIHIKDADPSPVPGQWGQERAAGEGSVDWEGFFRVVRDELPCVDLVIEREAGEQRIEDIGRAHKLVTRHADWIAHA